MTALRVLVTGVSLAAEARRILEGIGAAVVLMPSGTGRDAILRALAEAPTQAILMRGNPPIDAAIMDAAPELRVIAKHGAGVDSVDLAAAAQRGIRVMVAADANAPAVAEHTLALMFALGRDIVALAARTRGGAWDREGYSGREISGRRLGLVGFGRIARLVAAKARAVGMDVTALPHRPGSVDTALAREATSLGALLADSDIVSLHVPLTRETEGMIGRSALASMRKGALLVNTARGALIDETALLEALTSGHLGGAALDTLIQEPPPPDHPLLSAPRVIVTPHIASATGAALIRMGVVAAQNIVAVIKGQPLDPGNLVASGPPA
jgi:D-3-phosphoglycerate dehydrogenase / 2-oxoglutarate reductase